MLVRIQTQDFTNQRAGLSAGAASGGNMTPEESNLRCLEGSVRNLIAALCRHDGRVLRDCIPTTGTISGDLYAIVASAVLQQWDDDTLSDLQRRYPLPKPVAPAKAGNDGGGELPSVPCEVSDGGGSAERGGVCGSANVGTPLTPDDGPQPIRFKVSEPEPPMSYADVNVDSLASDSQLQELLEQARSTTRRNIAKAVQGRVTEPMPEQDIAVAIACMQAKTDAAHRVEERATYAEGQMRKARAEAFEATAALRQREAELRGTIKGRDKTIDRLCRHIAFQVAK